MIQKEKKTAIIAEYATHEGDTLSLIHIYPETMLQKLPALTVGDVVRAARRITTDTIYFLKGDEA